MTYAARVKSLRKIPLQFVADLTATREEEIGKKEERKRERKRRGRQQVKEKEKTKSKRTKRKEKKMAQGQ